MLVVETMDRNPHQEITCFVRQLLLINRLDTIVNLLLKYLRVARNDEQLLWRHQWHEKGTVVLHHWFHDYKFTETIL